MTRIGALQAQGNPLPFDPAQINFVASDFGNTIVGAVNDMVSGQVRVANSVFGGVPKVFSMLPAFPEIPQPAAIQSLPELPGIPGISGQSLPFPPIPGFPSAPAPVNGDGGLGGFPSLGSNSEDFWSGDLEFRE